MKIRINDKEIELPSLTASKSDYDKGKRTGIKLSTDIFQYYVNLVPIPWGHIETLNKKEKIIENFNKIHDEHKPLISDINFWWDGHVWIDSERNAALKLQLELRTDFVSDVVMDRDLKSIPEDIIIEDRIDYAIKQFDTQLSSLLQFNTKKIKCPAISMKTPSEVFRKQLDKIKDYNFKRFNVDWTGLSNLEPWLILTNFLKENNDIWCNMTSVNVRRRVKTIMPEDTKQQIKIRKSNLQTAFAYGVHTAGLGFYVFPHDDDVEPTAYLFNQQTLQYDIDPNGDYRTDDSISHNRLNQRVQMSHIYIKNNSYFDNYLPVNYLA